MNLTTELFRFTEHYSSLALGENENASLASLNLVVDFMRDLNIRNIQFVDLFEKYARLLTRLAKTSCFDCPKFKEHVRLIKNRAVIPRIHNFTGQVENYKFIGYIIEII